MGTDRPPRSHTSSFPTATLETTAPGGPPPMASSHPLPLLPPGTSIGRYVVIEELGSGGMGAVYAAFDSQLARRVAIKVVLPEADTPDARARLLGEAQAMARLTHPNVVAIYDVGPFRDAVFIAMEYVDGPTLKVWLRDPRPWRETLDALVAAGRGLAAAHAAGLVHRDFKPENVLIGRDGRVRVSDFGIARAERSGEELESQLTDERGDEAGGPPASGRVPSSRVDLELRAGPAVPAESNPSPLTSSSSFASLTSSTGAPHIPTAAPSSPTHPSSLNASLTLPGALIGTVGYMSPERAFDGQDDARSDQFAFCVALYLALYGVRPFEYKDLASYLQAICGPPRPPPADTKVPSWVAGVVLRGLAIEPSARFATMQELLDALGRDPGPRRRRLLAVVAALGIAGVTALGVMHQSRTLERACQTEGEAVHGVWNGATEEAAHTAFARSGVNGEERLWEATRARLDGYAHKWSASSVAACRATTVDHTESPTLLRRSRACLQTRLAELGQLARSLSTAEAALVEKGPDIVSSLAPIETCSDRDELLSMVEAPGDPAVQRRVVELRGVIAEAKALRATNHDADARARLLPTVEEARRIGYAPLLGEALVEEGISAHGGEGEQTLVEAYDVALASRRFVTAGRASQILTDLVGHTLGRHKEGHVWARLGEAAMGDATSLEADEERTSILLNETYIYDEESDAANAISAARRAQAIAARHHASDDIMSERLHVAMGVAEATGGDLAAARLEFQAALAGDEARLGLEHPRVGDRVSDLATVEINDAHYDVAVRYLDRALAIDETIPEELRLNTAVTLLNRAQALRRMGRCARALADTSRASEIYTKELGADTEDMVTIETIAADCHRALGHTEEAATAIAHAQRIASASPDTRAGAFIEMRFTQAEILGHKDPRAIALAKLAHDQMGTPMTADDRAQLAEIDAWLATGSEKP